MLKYDLLVYLGLLPIVGAIIMAAVLMTKTPADADIEMLAGIGEFCDLPASRFHVSPALAP